MLLTLSNARDIYCKHHICISPFSLAAVYNDVLWLNPFLQHALFRMLASTPKQAWRLDLEVANALSVVVEQTVPKLVHYFLVGLFQSLLK